MHGHPGFHFWCIGFAGTLLFELPIALWLLRHAEPGFGRRTALIVYANLATHPLVWFFFPTLPLPYWLSLTLSELWAFGAEAVFYALMSARIGVRRALVTSLLANGASFALGFALVRRFGRVIFAS